MDSGPSMSASSPKNSKSLALTRKPRHHRQSVSFSASDDGTGSNLSLESGTLSSLSSLDYHSRAHSPAHSTMGSSNSRSPGLFSFRTMSSLFGSPRSFQSLETASSTSRDHGDSSRPSEKYSGHKDAYEDSDDGYERASETDSDTLYEDDGPESDFEPLAPTGSSIPSASGPDMPPRPRSGTPAPHGMPSIHTPEERYSSGRSNVLGHYRDSDAESDYHHRVRLGQASGYGGGLGSGYDYNFQPRVGPSLETVPISGVPHPTSVHLDRAHTSGYVRRGLPPLPVTMTRSLPIHDPPHMQGYSMPQTYHSEFERPWYVSQAGQRVDGRLQAGSNNSFTTPSGAQSYHFNRSSWHSYFRPHHQGSVCSYEDYTYCSDSDSDGYDDSIYTDSISDTESSLYSDDY